MFSRKRGLVLFAFAIEEHFGNDGDHVKGGDLVIGLNVSVGASVVRIVPEGGYPGVLPALYVGGKAVADYQRLAAGKSVKLLKDSVEKAFVRLVEADPL